MEKIIFFKMQFYNIDIFQGWRNMSNALRFDSSSSNNTKHLASYK